MCLDWLFGNKEKEMFPSGKILWVVNLRNASGNWLLPQIKDTVLNNGYDGVALKVLHGVRYNGAFEDIEEFFDKLRGKIQIYGWQWNLLTDMNEAEKEAIWARKAVDAFKLDGFVANPEANAKRRPNVMRNYASELKERFPNEPVGYTSYRWPSVQHDYPWDTVEYFDYHAPQVYWAGRHNPAEQLQRSYDELMELKEMPVIPLGAAFTDPQFEPWEPTPDDLREFDQKARDLGLRGVQWFAWRGAKPLGLLPVLAELNWNIEDPDPKKYTQTELDQAVAEAEEKVKQRYEAVIQDLEVSIADKEAEAFNEGLGKAVEAFSHELTLKLSDIIKRYKR